MAKAHKIESVRLEGTVLALRVDGRDFRVDLSGQSERIARATQAERDNFEVSPSGYGIHWPDLDEDLSIDRLVGIRHEIPESAKSA